MSLPFHAAEPVAYRRTAGPATLVFGDDPARRAMLADLVATLGGRVEADAPLTDAAAVIERQDGTCALVLDLVADDGAALDGLLHTVQAGARAARLAAVIVAPFALVDIVHGQVDDPAVAIAVDGDTTGIAFALERLFRPRAAAFGEPDGGDPARRLAELGEETARISQALAALSGSIAARDAGGRDDRSDPQVALATARGLIRMRRLRERFFAPALFADPAWDMLLDLFVAGGENRRVAVSSLCIAAMVPATTALRWITTLTEHGLIARHADPDDGRRSFLSLTEASVTAMSDYLGAAVRDGLTVRR